MRLFYYLSCRTIADKRSNVLKLSYFCKITIFVIWLLWRLSTILSRGYPICFSGSGSCHFWLGNRHVSLSRIRELVTDFGQRDLPGSSQILLQLRFMCLVLKMCSGIRRSIGYPLTTFSFVQFGFSSFPITYRGLQWQRECQLVTKICNAALNQVVSTNLCLIYA